MDRAAAKQPDQFYVFPSAYQLFWFTLVAWYAAELMLTPKVSFRIGTEPFCIAILVLAVSGLSFHFAFRFANTRKSTQCARVESLSRFDERLAQQPGNHRSHLLGDPSQTINSSNWSLQGGNEFRTRVRLTLIVCLTVGFTPLLWIAEGDIVAVFRDAFLPSTRWSSIFQRARYGDVRDAFLELQMFLQAAVIVSAVILLSPDRKSIHNFSWRAVAFLLFAYMLARALNSGSRMTVIHVITPFLAACLWRTPKRYRRKVIVFGAPILASVAFLWSNATVTGRDAGRLNFRRALTPEYSGFEMFRELVFLVDQVPENSPYLWGDTYYAQVINPVPRFLWAGKPKNDAGLQLARLHGDMIGDEPKLTVAPGLIGEMYWNFGVPGVVVLSAFIGVICCEWDRWGHHNSECLLSFVIYGYGLSLLFICGRSINASTFYGLIAFWLVWRSCGLLNSRRVQSQVS